LEFFKTTYNKSLCRGRAWQVFRHDQVIALLATLTPTPESLGPWPYLKVIVDEVHMLFRVLSYVQTVVAVWWLLLEPGLVLRPLPTERSMFHNDVG